MWLLQILFISVTLVLGWILFGYFLLLWLKGRLRKKPSIQLPENLPSISVVVPCYNEKDQIREKLENLRSIRYPDHLREVVFADGGSTDGTLEILKGEMRENESVRLIRCPHKGKIRQLNHVLPLLRGDIIVNTDTDARFSEDLLQWIAAEFSVSHHVQVVGAYCKPIHTMGIEDYYWSAQNKGRLLESDAGTSAIVIAQCYAFRRNLLRSFPSDVVADDVYVAFLANSLGYRTTYSRKAMAVETRAPVSYEQFLLHKFRKSNAFLRESLRFLYKLPEMSPFGRMLFMTRTGQQIVLPWALLFWILLMVAHLTASEYVVTALCTAFLVLLFVATSQVFSWVTLPDGPHHHSLGTMIKGFALTTLIMLATGISYPFFRQGSSYSRLRAERSEGQSGEEKASYSLGSDP